MTEKILNIENFGTIDAESDKKLLQYFIETDSLKRLTDYKKNIIIGRKGSGKTAIYKYLQSRSSTLTKGLLFRDYPWKIHDKYRNSVVTEKESYVNSWLFMIYIEFIKLIVSDIDSYQKPLKKHVKRLKKWLIKNWGTSEFEFNKTMTPQRKKFNWSFNPQVLGCSLGSIGLDFERKENLSDTLVELNKKLETIILQLAKPEKQYKLLFDELDLGYNPKDESYKTRIIGLLLANFYCYNNLTQNSKFLHSFVFLRSDIYEVLDFQDKNKITDNIVELLNWEADDENSNLSLKRLISKRIKENLNTDTLDFKHNWNTIIENKNIGSNQLKWNYILERTFIRPRDIIKYLNLALDESKKRKKHDSKSTDLIINKDFHDCKKDYSDYLYKELKDEVLAKYPLFNNYLEVLRDIHNTTFTNEEFAKSFDTLKTRLELDNNAETILERLYEFSIIGFYKSGGGGYGGATYCFEYSDPSIKFNPKANGFKIHAGFKEYLELIEPR